MPDPPKKISIPATVLENQKPQFTKTTNANTQIQIPATVLEISSKQIQIPTVLGAGAFIKIPTTELEPDNQLKIPVQGDNEQTNIEAPYSRLNLKKLSAALDQTADRLLQNQQLNGLLFIGVLLSAVNGITKALAEEPIDKQKTGEAILSRVSQIIPTGVSKDKTFNWFDPNSRKDFRFEIGTESTNEGDKRFLKAFKVSKDKEKPDLEVFCISSLEEEDKKFKSWRVEKNDFSRAQLDSLTKAEFPREKSLGLSR